METNLPKKNNFLKFKASKKIDGKTRNDFALPIYIQRRKDMGITVSCPDMNVTRHLPLPQQYEKISAFYQDLCITIAEIDRISIEEFIERDFQTKENHRKNLFPRGLKDHLEIDIQKLKFKPPVAARLTTKSSRTWQEWCRKKIVKRRTNGSKKRRNHYLIPFSEIEPFLKKEFVDNPRLILDYVT